MAPKVEPEVHMTVRAHDRKSGQELLWLLVRSGGSCTDVLTVQLSGCGRALPVVSLEEEVVSYVRGRKGWRIRAVGARELVSLLYRPCRTAKRVILDPSPEVPATMVLGMVSVGRKRSIGSLLRRYRANPVSGGAHMERVSIPVPVEDTRQG